jgi:hypothetical protein
MTALARPLDPSWPTNRAVLILMPIGGAAFAARSWWVGPGELVAAAWAALFGVGSVLGTWALARELAPDDQRAAFVALALGVPAALLVEGASLPLLFSGMLLTRMVTRSVGPPPTVVDSVALTGLVAWTAVSLGAADVWLVAALAFAIDAHLPGGRGRAWLFTASCVAFAVLHTILLPRIAPALAADAASSPTALGEIGWAIPIGAAFIASIVRTRSVSSVADATDERLSARRVRAGMAVALLLAARSLPHGGEEVSASVLVWMTLAAVTLSDLLPGGERRA